MYARASPHAARLTLHITGRRRSHACVRKRFSLSTAAMVSRSRRRRSFSGSEDEALRLIERRRSRRPRLRHMPPAYRQWRPQAPGHGEGLHIFDDARRIVAG